MPGLRLPSPRRTARSLEPATTQEPQHANARAMGQQIDYDVGDTCSCPCWIAGVETGGNRPGADALSPDLTSRC